jgi:8-oxo-dGTP pyrophosphatase MutT (NUDIX family)
MNRIGGSGKEFRYCAELSTDGGFAMRRRPSARLLIIDAQQRILLFRFVFRQGPLAGQDYWATPGGGVENQETFEQAAVRELHEETGIRIEHVEAHVAEREFVLQLPDGEHVMAQERFFLIAVDNDSLSRDGWTAQEVEIMADHKWWTRDELARTEATVWPRDLLEMTAAALSR